MDYTQSTTNIFFPEQQEPIYDSNDFVSKYQFEEYWKREKDRCINGFYIADGQVKISGRLYFHCVYGKIAAYKIKTVNGKEKKVREIITPILRDVDWDIINEDLEKCGEEGKFYDLVGSRDFGKSVIAASLAAHQYTFFPKSEAVISGGAASYIKLATDKIEDLLLNIHPVFRKQRLTSDWKKEIVAGWKDKKTGLADPKSSQSSIKVRNYENGTNTMAANGTRPGFHLIDETGTIENLIGCVKDSDGCWWSGDGDKPSCLVMLCGTGGDMEVGAESGEIFFNPESYNMLSFPNPESPGEKMGRFVSALKAKMAYKEPKSLSEYLGISHPDLDAITILVSNEEKCLKEWWEPGYARALKSGNPKTITKFLAYWPIKPSDSFLVIAKNDFNILAAKAQQGRLRSVLDSRKELPFWKVEFFHDGEKIDFKSSDKNLITQFPVKDQNKDAPVFILEHPPKDIPFGLYTAGVDPYRFAEAENSDSLGAVYIFKRIHEINSEQYQDMFVAWYVARPSNKSVWEEQARMLIKYYNAQTLCENDEMSFIDYMLAKGDGHFLVDQPVWLKEYVPNTSMTRNKGVSTAPKPIREFLDGTLKQYLDDALQKVKDEKGSVISETLGVTKVFDMMLLEEVIKYNKEKGNYDRIKAAQLALAQARKMDPIIGASGAKDVRYDNYFARHKQKSTTTLFQRPTAHNIKRHTTTRKLFGK